LTALLLAPIVGGSVVFAQQITQNPQPLGQDPIKYIDNPTPKLPANQSLPQSQLISRDSILAQTKVPNGGKIISLELKTWQEHLSQQKEAKGAAPLVADGCQVWELKTSYPEYYHFKLGSVKNAVVTQAFDAETGLLLHQRTQGDFAGHPAQFQ